MNLETIVRTIVRRVLEEIYSCNRPYAIISTKEIKRIVAMYDSALARNSNMYHVYKKIIAQLKTIFRIVEEDGAWIIVAP